MIADIVKAFDIIVKKRVAVEDVIECQTYEEYVKATEIYYDKMVNHENISKESWLKQWLIDSQTFFFLKEVIVNESNVD